MGISLQNNHSQANIKEGFLKKTLRKFLIKGTPETLGLINRDEYQEIISSIRDSRKDWLCACQNFEYADDSLMVDYYIYKMKACQLRYEYFIKKAKEKGIKVDVLEASYTGITACEVKI